MEVRPFTELEREDMLRRYREAMVEYNAAMDRDDEERADHFSAKTDLQLRLYLAGLPRPVMSCCPFCAKPLLRTFDPHGFDGHWWRTSATPTEIPACTHFCFMVGAVNYQGLSPTGGEFEAHPGPEVPYVIPRLLDYEGMIAVISQVRMKAGYLAYPIAYFAKRRPPVEELTAGWGRTVYLYTNAFGEDGWKEAAETWDFELRPWLDRGKVRWCPPDSDNRALSEDPPGECPYLDLPGVRQRIIVEDQDFWEAGLPEGD